MSIHQKRILEAASRPLARFALSILALDCSSSGVDLGGGSVHQNLVQGSRCSASTVLDADVVVKNQAELADLAGCEEISGGLHIQTFPSADLAPLASLRTVGGSFELGASTVPQVLEAGEDLDAFQRYLDADQALVDAGWLASLSGVESLTHVGALTVRGILAADLSAFSSLRTVGSDLADSYNSVLSIGYNRNLVDLRGLEEVRGIRALSISKNASLRSLNGLTLSANLINVELTSSPALTDITALASTTDISGNLYLQNTGLENLNALGTLRTVAHLIVIDNAELADTSGLDSFVGADTMYFQNNAVLTELPPFDHVVLLSTAAISVLDNPSLEVVNLNFESYVSYGRLVHGSYRQIDTDVIEIGNNAALRSIDSPVGFSGAQIFSVYDNASLMHVGLQSFHRFDVLELDNNPRLSSVDLGPRVDVGSLVVTRNPALSTLAFDGVRAFDRSISGNADGAAP